MALLGGSGVAADWYRRGGRLAGMADQPAGHRPVAGASSFQARPAPHPPAGGAHIAARADLPVGAEDQRRAGPLIAGHAQPAGDHGDPEAMAGPAGVVHPAIAWLAI